MLSKRANGRCCPKSFASIGRAHTHALQSYTTCTYNTPAYIVVSLLGGLVVRRDEFGTQRSKNGLVHPLILSSARFNTAQIVGACDTGRAATGGLYLSRHVGDSFRAANIVNALNGLLGCRIVGMAMDRQRGYAMRDTPNVQIMDIVNVWQGGNPIQQVLVLDRTGNLLQ
jgi:hypothetical protein